ncbi:MAG: glycosyltransferase family 4 protein [Bryobacterales bacterium]|nr:glycosyltransferase family 4 protein [Bryobacterales bacterium]
MSEPFDREAYQSLLEQGLELQRRHDAVLGSRTWQMQLAVGEALRDPAKVLRLPSALWSILRSSPEQPAPPPLVVAAPPEPLPATKPLALALVPWLQLGGAERVVVELMQGLAGEIDFAVLPASPRGPADAAFFSAPGWIFPPPEGDYAARAAEILCNNPVRVVVVSSCPEAYAALPALREASGASFVDILHNAAPEGSLGASIARDRWLDLHFAVGEAQAEALRRGGVAPKKIRLARNGVDCDGRFRPAEPGAPSNHLRLGWVGRLSEEKDPALFVRTVAALPDAEGLLIGDGPERFRIEQLIRALGVADRVRITGFTDRVTERLAPLDALLLTSRVEGSPLTVLEAMSLRKPVVAADVGGVREAVEDGVTGFLVAERTQRAFAEAAGRLRDPELRRRMGEAARRVVVERFSRTAMLAAYREGFRSLGTL